MIEEKIKEFIGTRPVGICALGPSLKILDDNIQVFKAKDICWAAINDVVCANDILKKIDKRVELYFCCAFECVARQRQLELREFLNQEKSLVITRRMFFIPTPEEENLIIDHDSLKWATNLIERSGYNSLFCLVMDLITSGVKNIYIFGADGIVRAPELTKYKQDLYCKYPDDLTSSFAISNDTGKFWFFRSEVERFGIDYSSLRIFNVCPDSVIDVFPRVSVADAINNICIN